MGFLKNSVICFNHPTSTYRPGGILTGNLVIHFNSSKVIRGIYFTITGKASVYWSESSSTTNSDGSSSNTSTSYTNKEKYFKKIFYVVCDEKSGIEFPSGKHVFSFKYVLPSNLPPSFEGMHGKIIYGVKATLVRPWKFDKHVEAPFIVETLFNIQDHALARVPAVLTMEKQFGILFKSKPLKTILRLPNTGFAPGQIIPMRLEVLNNSNTAVTSVSIKLRKITTFHATAKDNKIEETLSKNPIPYLIKPCTSVSFNHSLQVPFNMIFHDLSNCKIIDIDYAIRVELHTGGLTKNLVGNIPLYPILHML